MRWGTRSRRAFLQGVAYAGTVPIFLILRGEVSLHQGSMRFNLAGEFKWVSLVYDGILGHVPCRKYYSAGAVDTCCCDSGLRSSGGYGA